MRLLQRWLSDLLNPGSWAGAGLLRRDPEDPEALWQGLGQGLKTPHGSGAGARLHVAAREHAADAEPC